MALGVTEKRLDNLHWPLVLCTVVICSLGLWNLASATKNAPMFMALAQTRWMIFVGLPAVIVLLFIDYRWLQTVAWPGYFAALGLLGGVAFFGKRVLGARRWLQVGSMQIQPSEFVKLAVIVILAPSWANADACPPPRRHDEIGNMLTMSQRILPSASSAIARDGAPSAPTTPATAAAFRARRRVIPCSVMCSSRCNTSRASCRSQLCWT